MELNTTVTPQQLLQDPLMDGYLAIVLPTGPFPPTNKAKKKCNDDVAQESTVYDDDEDLGGALKEAVENDEEVIATTD